MNYNLFQMINQWAGHFAWLDWIMVAISQNALYIYAAILAFLWFKGNESLKISILYSGITGFLALFLNYLIATIYFEPRPFVNHTVNLLIPHAADASFPSDHTSGAFALAISMLTHNRKWGYGMILLAVLTGISRVFVGHHYPGDVVGSIVVAYISSFFILRCEKWIEPILRRILNMYEKIKLGMNRP